jgi:hypothetical protein
MCFIMFIYLCWYELKDAIVQTHYEIKSIYTILHMNFLGYNGPFKVVLGKTLHHFVVFFSSLQDFIFCDI